MSSPARSSQDTAHYEQDSPQRDTLQEHASCQQTGWRPDRPVDGGWQQQTWATAYARPAGMGVDPADRTPSRACNAALGPTTPDDASDMRETLGRALGQLQSNTQAAAEVALRQASTTALVSEFVNTLVAEVEEQIAGRQQLSAMVTRLQDENKELSAVVEELTRQLKTERQSCSSLERLQETWRHEMESWQRRCHEAEALTVQLKHRMTQVVADLEAAQGEKAALKKAQQAAAEELDEAQQAADKRRLACELLKQQKQQLQNQVKQMVHAERELTVQLRGAHCEIETQICALKDEVKVERRAKVELKRRKADLEREVKELLRAQDAHRLQSQEVAGLKSEVQTSLEAIKALKSELKQERRRRKALSNQSNVTELEHPSKVLAFQLSSSPDAIGYSGDSSSTNKGSLSKK